MLKSPPSSRALLQQIRAFLLVGVVATLVHYAIMGGMVEFWGYPAVYAMLFGYIGGGVTSYILNRAFTYEATRTHKEATWRFFLVALFGFGLTYVFGTFFTKVIGFHYLLSQMIVTVIVLFWSFMAHKIWSFRAK